MFTEKMSEKQRKFPYIPCPRTLIDSPTFDCVQLCCLFLYCCILRVLCVFWIQILLPFLFANTLSHGTSSHSHQCVFHRIEVLTLRKSKLSDFSFLDHSFGVVSKNSLSNARPARSSMMISYRSFFQFCVLHLGF